MTEIADIEADVLAEMVPLPKAKRAVTPKYKKDGTLSTVGLKHLGDDWESCGGDHTAIDWVVFNLGSRQQIGERLIREGWRPTRFTEQGQPMVDEGTLSGIDLPLSRKISRYLMLQKRVSQITSWMDKVDDDSRVRCHYRTLGAITHRMSCNTPNLQQDTRPPVRVRGRVPVVLDCPGRSSAYRYRPCRYRTALPCPLSQRPEIHRGTDPWRRSHKNSGTCWTP
jgi:hypothetical protein